MGVQEAGVYWPFKTILSGFGITLVEDSTSIKIATTGAGPGGGDMLSTVYATNGQVGVVDKAVSAQTVTGVVAHATLADSVPWGGIIGAPTIFPTDWGSIANKPATMPPGPHNLTHVTGGNDIIPLATTLAVGLTGILSGKITDYKAGDGTWRDLNTQVGSNPLTMNAVLTCTKAVTCSAGLTVSAGNLTLSGTNLQINTGNFLVNNPSGAWCGIYNTGANNAVFGFANGATISKDTLLLYKGSGARALTLNYMDANGTLVYTGEVVTTYNPSGTYSFRAGTHIAGTLDLPGDNTAWSKAPFLSQSQSGGGFAGYGMVSQGYWGCALGAWQTGLWLATSANTFVQLTDNSGHIVAGALAAGVAVANLGYAPVSRGGDTMTGDLLIQKGAALFRTYQDNNNFQRLQSNLGLFVAADYNAQGGQIVIQATGGSQVAGITLKSRGGYSFSIWGEDNGALYAIRNNDGLVKQLLP